MTKTVVPNIPCTVDVSFDEQEAILEKHELEFGVATPGTMATASSADFGSPFGIFASFAASSQRALFVNTTIDEEQKSNEADDDAECLGITRPEYNQEDDDESTDSKRLGIERTSYEVPEGDIPISPIDQFFKRKKKRTSRNNDSDDDGDDLWQLNLRRNHNFDASFLKSPSESDDMPNDDVGRLLHKQTASGHYLMNSRPLDAPMGGIRYSLTDGKDSMTTLMKTVSDSRLVSPKTRPNVTRNSSTPSLRGSPTDGASFKIFLLLIQPKSKIFEIIQLFYAPSQTLVRDLLEMVPANATEPALGMQKYCAVCRPQDDGREIDLDLMASASNGTFDDCARIIRGEILVAVPDGYNGPMCAKLAKPLLTNPKVTRLLKRSDPLAPSKKKKKKSSSSSSRRYKTISVEKERQPNPYDSKANIVKEGIDEKERSLLKKAYVEEDDDSCESFNPRSTWQTTMSFRSDSSCSSVGSARSINSTDFISTPVTRPSRRSSNFSDHRMTIPENPAEMDDQAPPSPEQLSDDASPLTAGSKSQFAALEAKLQSKDLDGAIDAFSKMLSEMGAPNDDVMKQLYQALQKKEAAATTKV